MKVRLAEERDIPQIHDLLSQVVAGGARTSQRTP